MAVYIDTTTNFAFKKLFAHQSKKEIALSFLNSVLDRQGDEQIVSAVVNDPSNLPHSKEWEFSIVDVYCTDQRGRHYIIEMQVSCQDDYRQRSQYYSSAAIMKQHPRGSYYHELCPVI